MLDSRGFDLWADGYDESVGLSDDSGAYPFAGYRAVLGSIYDAAVQTPGARILDLGFGTAVLTARLYEAGCVVYGQDFSPRMLETAQEKMPQARLYTGDLSLGLVPELEGERFDYIIATYSLHHLDDERRTKLIRDLLGRLNPGGAVLIGDVAFADRADLERCREKAGDEWDDDEIYIVADELKKSFPTAVFRPVSYCAGIVTITPDSVIELTEITEDNWLEAASLSVKERQRGFVAPAVGIIARGYVYRDCGARVYAVESGGVMVGMALVREFTDEPLGYDLQQFMIDARYQGRGYGSRALELILDRLRREGRYDSVEVCVKKEDTEAVALYEKHGFTDSGYVDEDLPDCVNMICRLF